MRVRRLDHNHDWTFGQGLANYADKSEAIAQCVKTRLWSFTNDWFLDLEHGLPWLEKMGRTVNLSDWELRIKKQVLQTKGVVSITEYDANFEPNRRKMTIELSYLDIYGKENSVSYSS